MEFTELPFEYETRYGDQYKEWGIPMERAALLEERDRQLENFLAAPRGRIGGAQAARTLTNQSIPDSTWTSVSFDTENYDDEDYFDASAPTRLTVPADGLYMVTFTTNLARNGTGTRQARVYKNATSGVVSDARNAVGSTVWFHASISQVVGLDAGDYLEAQLYQTSGGSLNVEVGTGAGTADQPPQFSIARFK